jgi:hypothetical protein
MRVRRIDLGTLAAPVRRADGTIVVEARIARTGVQTYRNADGSTRVEYRPDAEVSKAMTSLRLVPLTNLHPPTMLDAGNARAHSVGAVGENIRRDGKWIVAPLAVHDGATVKQMDSGELRQVSAGYECELDETPGTTPDGERYDAVQREITHNHVALVPNARAGKDAAVRMDAAISDEEAPRRSTVMDLQQALAALAAAQEKLGAEKSRADSAVHAHADLQKRFDVLQAERDDAKEKLAKADKARTDAEAAVPGKVKARVALETQAREILGAHFDAEEGDEGEPEQKFDAMSDREIKLAVIKQVTDFDVPADKSDEYVNARFDAACERASASADTFRAANDIIAGNHTHMDALAVEQAKTDKAREAMLEANRNGWRPAGTVAQPTK